MKKQLSDMTLQELWELFPIFLSEHQECWEGWFQKEAARLKKVLPMKHIIRLEHIGSTAVSTIWAKPIIDILLEIDSSEKIKEYTLLLIQAGYMCMSMHENRCSFNRGYTPDGFEKKVFHLHLRCNGDHDELYFRDYLNEFPDIAYEYEQLKLSLWKQYEHDRDSYTESKTDFIKKYTEKAILRYGNRY